VNLWMPVLDKRRKHHEKHKTQPFKEY